MILRAWINKDIDLFIKDMAPAIKGATLIDIDENGIIIKTETKTRILFSYFPFNVIEEIRYLQEK